tara:strand:+ start:1225 stop:1341 length:117 start_codon:yes stop_codon:yes gene_type:complete
LDLPIMVWFVGGLMFFLLGFKGVLWLLGVIALLILILL